MSLTSTAVHAVEQALLRASEEGYFEDEIKDEVDSFALGLGDNARLIAAAPDLLHALRFLKWHADPSTRDGQEARELADAAINKAEVGA